MKGIHVVRDRGTAMGTRMRLLTVGLALATAVMAGCSSTTAGSSGAMQDDATAPASAASSASSSAVPTAPAPSPDPATPTAEPTAATASPVASPTDSPPPADSPDDPALLGKSYGSNDVCDTGLPYACGDTGPGGGTIFYVSSTRFACGADMGSFCNYLEVAPNLWAPNSQHSCKNVKSGGTCGGSAQQTSDFAGNGKGITLCTGGKAQAIPNQKSGSAVGTGYANTAILVPFCSPSDAPNIARAYDGGGMTDWFVPSLDEMLALWSYPNRNAIGGFPPSAYWSSTGMTKNPEYGDAFYIINYHNQGNSSYDPMKMGLGFRPIRAF